MREQASDDVSGEKQDEGGSKVLSLSTVGTTLALQPRQGVVTANNSRADRTLSTRGTCDLGCNHIMLRS